MRNTTTNRWIVGIDISKLTLDIYLSDQQDGTGNDTQVPNDPQGFVQLGKWLDDQGASRSQTILVSEHTGRYGERLLAWSTENEWPHAVVKTTALGKVSDEHHRKTDGYDARKLAEYGWRFRDQLRLQEAPKSTIRQLKRLQAERRKMVDRRGGLKGKCKEASYHDADMSQLLGMWRQQIQMLSDHIEQIEERIRELISEDQALGCRYQTMRSAPGIGPVIGCFWLCLFAGQQTLNPRKISARFGFAPHPHRSGSSVYQPNHSSGFGNGEMRRLMHQAARSVATHTPHYREYYETKKAKGKPEKLIINNIINKLIHLYCAMWNNRSQYDPNYIQKMKKHWKKSA